MAKKITRKQKEVFDALHNFITESRISPTILEMAEQFSMTKKGMYDHLIALKKKGWITWIDKSPRSIQILKEEE